MTRTLQMITNKPHNFGTREVSVNTIIRMEQNLFSQSEGQHR